MDTKIIYRILQRLNESSNYPEFVDISKADVDEILGAFISKGIIIRKRVEIYEDNTIDYGYFLTGRGKVKLLEFMKIYS